MKGGFTTKDTTITVTVKKPENGRDMQLGEALSHDLPERRGPRHCATLSGAVVLVVRHLMSSEYP
jgi:hypothetical protein